MSKSTKIIAALGVVAGLGVAALPFAGAEAATDQTDTISVSIADNCAIAYQSTAHADGTGTYKGTWSGNKLTASIINNQADTNIGGTNFNVVCNDNKGYDIKLTASALAGEAVSPKVAESIPYITSNAAPSAGTSSWGVKSGDNWILDGGKVTTGASATASTDFAISYGVATSSTLQADTYTGTAKYTLTHPATS